MIDFKASVDAAEARIRSHVRETQLEHSPVLSELTQASVYVKLENLQRTGSFKVRGAFNRLLCLTGEEKARGIVAATSGNHGTAVALGMSTLGIKGIIFVPESAAPEKIANIRRLGGDVQTKGAEGGATEVYARAYASERGMTYVSPYNDAAVIAGQGTIGAEIARQLPSVGAVVVPIGGGGMISGIAGYLKAIRSGVFVVGASARNSRAMSASVRAGRIIEVEHLPTLSDGTAGGVEPGAMTFDLCRTLVDEFVDVGEDAIRSALRLFIDSHHMLCEGAAAVAIASLLAVKERMHGKTVVVVICGANIGADRLREALEEKVC